MWKGLERDPVSSSYGACRDHSVGMTLWFHFFSFFPFLTRWLGKKNFFGGKLFAFGSSALLLPHASAVSAWLMLLAFTKSSKNKDYLDTEEKESIKQSGTCSCQQYRLAHSWCLVNLLKPSRVSKCVYQGNSSLRLGMCRQVCGTHYGTSEISQTNHFTGIYAYAWKSTSDVCLQRNKEFMFFLWTQK